eukprot:2541034-Pyramimonas_sp.AAC.1
MELASDRQRGDAPHPPQRLSNMAAALVGARSRASVLAWLATQRGEFFDPVSDTASGLLM